MPNENQYVLKSVNEASKTWQSAFNDRDPAGCTAPYEADAVMHARPFGTFRSTAEIQAFWQKLINDGFADGEYVDPHIEVIDDHAGGADGWLENEQRHWGHSQRTVGCTERWKCEVT